MCSSTPLIADETETITIKGNIYMNRIDMFNNHFPILFNIQ